MNLADFQRGDAVYYFAPGQKRRRVGVISEINMVDGVGFATLSKLTRSSQINENYIVGKVPQTEATKSRMGRDGQRKKTERVPGGRKLRGVANGQGEDLFTAAEARRAKERIDEKERGGIQQGSQGMEGGKVVRVRRPSRRRRKARVQRKRASVRRQSSSSRQAGTAAAGSGILDADLQDRTHMAGSESPGILREGMAVAGVESDKPTLGRKRKKRVKKKTTRKK